MMLFFHILPEWLKRVLIGALALGVTLFVMVFPIWVFTAAPVVAAWIFGTLFILAASYLVGWLIRL